MWWFIGIFTFLIVIAIAFVVKMLHGTRMSANNVFLPWDIQSVPELDSKDFEKVESIVKNLEFCGFIPVGDFKLIDGAQPESHTKTVQTTQTKSEHLKYLKIYLDVKLQALATIYISIHKQTILTTDFLHANESFNEKISKTIHLGLDSTFIDSYEVIGTTQLEGPLFPCKSCTRIYCSDFNRLLQFIKEFQNRIQLDTLNHQLNPNFLDYDIETYLNMRLKEDYETFLAQKVVTYDATTELYQFKIMPCLRATFKMIKFMLFEEPKLRKAGCSFVSINTTTKFHAKQYLLLLFLALAILTLGVLTENLLVIAGTAIVALILFILQIYLYLRSSKKFWA
ncbi:MAG: hypothetical protein ACRCWY_00335, partial [Cellulosilyticaceae bacterium]